MTTLQTWGGNLVFTPARLERPNTVEHLAAIVASSRQVTVHAALHSFSGVVATDRVALDLGALPADIQVLGPDPDLPGKTRVRFAGVWPMREALRALDRRGLALENSGSNAAPTLLGALATAVHGSGVAWGSVAHPEVVRAVTLVDGQGEIRRLDEARLEDRAVLRAVRAGLGAHGVVVGVEVAAVPAYRLRLDGQTGSLAQALDRRVREVPGRRYEVLWYPGIDRALRIYRDETDLPLSPNRGFRAFWEEEVEGNLALGTLLAAADRAPAARVPPLRELLASTFPEDRADYVDTSWGGLTGYRRFRAVDLEHGLPEDRLEQALEAVARLAYDFEARGDYVLDLPVNVRWSASDQDTCLSPAVGRATAWVDVACYAGRQAYGPFLRAIEDALLQLGGRPHPGKVGWQAPGASWDQAAWAHFWQVRADLDPQRRFINRHLADLEAGRRLDPGF